MDAELMSNRELTGVSLVIPSYNEELSIADVIVEYRAHLERCDCPFEIIVVDDDSKDRTAELAMKAGARVIRHPQNFGVGAARKTGIRAAKWNAILMTDGDGTYPAERVPEMVEHLQYSDIVVGTRGEERGRFRFLRWMVKRGICRFTCYLTGADIPDLNSGLRLFYRDLALRFFYLLPDGHSWVNTITLCSLTNGFPVDFLPIDYRRRIGKSKFHPVRDTYKYFLTLVRTVTYFVPLQVFMPKSLLLLGIGAATLTHGVVRGDIYETSMLVTIAGLFTFFFGLLADQNACICSELEYYRRTLDERAGKAVRSLVGDTCNV